MIAGSPSQIAVNPATERGEANGKAASHWLPASVIPDDHIRGHRGKCDLADR